MKLNFSKSKNQDGNLQRRIALIAILVLVGSGLPSSLAQTKSQKRITSLQSGETASGTRVSLFSDSSLSDYEAFRRGDRFYVKIPLAAFEGAKPNLRGAGFEDIQVQPVGDSIVVSFRLQPGTTARVDQRSNRLDVYFTSPNQLMRNASVSPTPNRTANAQVPGIVTLDNNRRPQGQRSSYAAGPMPPDTPGPNRPRVVTEQQSSARPSVDSTSSRNYPQNSYDRDPSTGSNNRTRSGSTPSKVEAAPNATLESSSARTNTPATLAPSATPSYSPSSYSTPYSPVSAKPLAQSPVTSSSAGWTKRLNVVSQWISANRIPAAVGAAILFLLIASAVAMLYRRRRKPVATRRSKVPGVQPKYSPEADLDDFRDDFDDEAYETVFDDYASEATQPKSKVNLPFADDSNAGTRQWANDLPESNPRPAPDVTSPYVAATPTMPIHAMKHEEYEREVFEL
ncbi:MAG TPA: hypothetical protein VJU86_15170 [Pyrinomonadaceae bacterium]|nr:hypothetical protein [Pyrinomonadaceae bacterium]